MQMKLALFCILLAISAAGALSATDTYVVVRKSSLSSAAEAITVQLPSGTTRTVAFRGASVDCSVACEVTIERDGTAATTTALSVAKVNGTSPASAASAYRSSNVGAGTEIGRQSVAAGGKLVLDLTNKGLLAGENLTIKTNSISGDVIVNIEWTE